jgi:hypothetical protein
MKIQNLKVFAKNPRASQIIEEWLDTQFVSAAQLPEGTVNEFLMAIIELPGDRLVMKLYRDKLNVPKIKEEMARDKTLSFAYFLQIKFKDGEANTLMLAVAPDRDTRIQYAQQKPKDPVPKLKELAKEDLGKLRNTYQAYATFPDVEELRQFLIAVETE